MLVGLALVHWTGCEWLDPVVALLIAGAIVVTGLRLVAALAGACSSTRRCPTRSSPRSATRSRTSRGRGVVGYHQLRTRRAGARRYVDLHVQFRAGTTLEEAHATAHELQDAIARALRGADVLIHLEPEDRVREDPIGDELPAHRAAERPAADARAQRRLIAAASATASTTPA